MMGDVWATGARGDQSGNTEDGSLSLRMLPVMRRTMSVAAIARKPTDGLCQWVPWRGAAVAWVAPGGTFFGDGWRGDGYRVSHVDTVGPL